MRDVGYGATRPRRPGAVRTSVGWAGMVSFLIVLGSMLATLLFSYFYLRDGFETWPPTTLGLHPLPRASTVTGLLIASLVAATLASRNATPDGRVGMVRVALGSILALGAAVVVLLVVEQGALAIVPQQSVYASLFFVLTAFVMGNVVIALGMTALLLLRIGTTPFPPRQQTLVAITMLYWGFVVVSWVLVYLTLYWTPRW